MNNQFKTYYCDNIDDVNSTAPLNPMQLLTMKTKIVMPPPEIFQKEDMYCWKYWQQVQHVCNLMEKGSFCYSAVLSEMELPKIKE